MAPYIREIEKLKQKTIFRLLYEPFINKKPTPYQKKNPIFQPTNQKKPDPPIIYPFHPES
jgi:hypothetical protein